MTTPLYDIAKDKEFRDSLARLAEPGISKDLRKLIVKEVMQAIHAHAAAEVERERAKVVEREVHIQPYKYLIRFLPDDGLEVHVIGLLT